MKPQDRGLVRHILIRKGFTSGEIMVCLVINGKSLPKEGQACKHFAGKSQEMTSIWLNYNTKNTNVVMGNRRQSTMGTKYDNRCYS